jgi:pimeloyl-ACP methyl ester carboxylesterase
MPGHYTHTSRYDFGIDHQLTMRDGHILAVREMGPDYGVPVVMVPGMPASRKGPYITHAELLQLGIKLLAIDRAGFGDSDPHPEATECDTARDIQDVLDTFCIARAGIIARSAGVRHGLAAAALLQERIAALVCLGGAMPQSAELDWAQGMNEDNVRAFSSDQEDGDITSYVVGLQKDPFSHFERIKSHLVSHDYMVLYSDCRLSDVAMGMAAGAADGEGWIREAARFAQPWAFDARTIVTPTLIWGDEQDSFTPVHHHTWLARQLSRASVEVVLNPRAGHFGALDFTSLAVHFIRSHYLGEQRESLIRPLERVLVERQLGRVFSPQKLLDEIDENGDFISNIPAHFDFFAALEQGSEAHETLLRYKYSEGYFATQAVKLVLTREVHTLLDQYPELNDQVKR